MKFHWEITQEDIEKISSFVNSTQTNKFVSTRFINNIKQKNVSLSNKNVWKHLTMCLLTTQQRSGPKSKVKQFITQKSYPLDKTQLEKQKNIYQFVYKTLTNFGGIRRTKSIANEIEYNLKLINSNQWVEVQKRLKSLKSNDSKENERDVANYLDNTIKGFGPKQSRNFLQSLGISKYEIPLDSRIIKWFNRFGFPIKLNSSMLSNVEMYVFIEDAIQELCKRAKVYPTILDACIFSSFDGNDWEDVEVIW